MPTKSQIAANRRNSQLSTGPRSDAGKAVSRANALRSGLYAESLVIPGEDAAAFDALVAEYQTQFQPATRAERDLVDALVRNQWLIRRVCRIETDLWHEMLENNPEAFRTLRPHGGPSIAFAFRHFEMELTRIQVRLNTLDRSYHRTLNQLRGLAAARPAAPQVEAPAEAPETCPEPIEPTTASPEIGFVPANSTSAAPPAPDRPSPTPNPPFPAHAPSRTRPRLRFGERP
ncbi:MAG TPA: hypothetical protein VKX45_12335 [Bryobacteraceae bacterium]|jgi:hypothetical protein|nr:hypothetical protein [Bryobacteraceae bacterium]